MTQLAQQQAGAFIAVAILVAVLTLALSLAEPKK